MATTVKPATAMAEDVGTNPADVLVVFGITGDLAKVMTFRRCTGSSSAAC